MKRVLLIFLFFPLLCYSQWLNPNGGNAIGIQNTGLKITKTFSPQALEYFNRMPVKPANDTLMIYAELIDSLVSNGAWNKLCVFVWNANRDTTSALLNMKGTSFTGISIGGPAFVPYRGFTCATNKYINAQFNPTTAGSIFTQNSASFAIYSNTDYTTGTTNLGGLLDFSSYNNLNANYTNQMYYALNTDGYSPVANVNTIGLFAVSRTAANLTVGYKDTDSINSYNRASTGLGDGNFFIGAINNNGNAANYSPRQVAYYFMGSGLTSDDIKNISRCASRCLVKLGADLLVRIVCDGNSLTGGSPNYTTKLQDTLSASSYQVTNKGISGQVIQEMITRYPTRINHLNIHKKNVLIFWEGVNAMSTLGFPNADSIYRVHKEYGLLAKQSGRWDKVIIMTTLPFGTNEDLNKSRDTLNGMFIAHYSEFADTIIDLCADANIGQWGDQLNTLFYNADKIHLIDAGQAVVMRMVYVALKNLKVIQ